MFLTLFRVSPILVAPKIRRTDAEALIRVTLGLWVATGHSSYFGFLGRHSPKTETQKKVAKIRIIGPKPWQLIYSPI